MISKRLQAIASLIDKNSKVIDIGTDHAYLPIFLYNNNITNKITATDVSENVLKSSFKNLTKNGLENKIKLIKSDGFTNVFEKYDLAVIAGMGTHTIIKILNSSNIPDKLIIQSNNNVDRLRKFMNKLDYKIDEEIAIIDKNKYYNIIKYEKGKEKLDSGQILFGKSNNKNYYKYLLEKNKLLYEKSKNEKYIDNIKILQNIIEKIPD